MIERALLIFGGALVAMLAVNIVLKSWDVLEGESIIRRKEKERRKFRRALRRARRFNVKLQPIKPGQIFGYARVR